MSLQLTHIYLLWGSVNIVGKSYPQGIMCAILYAYEKKKTE